MLVFLKASIYLKTHSKNCDCVFQGSDKPGQPLTNQENTAWVPHLIDRQFIHSMVISYSDYNLYMPIVKTPFFNIIQGTQTDFNMCRLTILSYFLTN